MLHILPKSQVSRTQLAACDIGRTKAQTTDGTEFSAIHLYLQCPHIGWRSASPNNLHWGGLCLPNHARIMVHMAHTEDLMKGIAWRRASTPAAAIN